MKYTVLPTSHIEGKIKLPASKSISNRALILKALSKSPYPIENLSDCDDTEVMSDAFSSGKQDIDIKAAGTSMRFLTAYLSLTAGTWSITGTERMRNRPIRILVDALRSLGASIDYMEKEGFPPLKITGKKLKGGSVHLDGSVSSQYISALMMIAPCMDEGLEIRLQGEVISRPYIHLTAKMMETFGVKTHWKNETIKIEPQTYKGVPYTVESDWSAASYWYEILALAKDGAEFELQGLNENSCQGDARTAQLFRQLGVSTTFTSEGVRLSRQNTRIQRFEYDFISEPDLAQTFAVTCALMNIPFYFTGLQSLRIKETDRLAALQNEMKKLGYLLRITGDSVLQWNGERCETAETPEIDTYEDHRMAMAFAPASLVIGKININEPLVVTKSYPGYWNDLLSAGFIVEQL